MDKKQKGFYWAIGLNQLTLRMIGLWPFNSNKSTQRILATPTIVIGIVIFLTVPQAYALIKVRRQLLPVVDNIPISLCNLVAVVKLIILWKGSKVLESLINEMWIDWQCTPRSDIETEMMQVQANRCLLISLIGGSSSAFVTIMWFTFPLFNFSIRTLNNITDPDPMRQLIFQSYYPYNVFKSPMYELTYLQQFCAGSLVPFLFFVAENLFTTFVLHACGQCQIVESRFQRLANISPTSHYFNDRLRQIVNGHVRLIRFVDNIEILFNYSILTQTIALTAVIGCFGFTLLKTVEDKLDPWQIFTRSVSPLLLLMYALIDCGAGEFLAIKSFRLLKASYQTNLQSLPNSCARDIIILMIRSQKPLQLTAGNFYDLTLNNFLQLVKNIGGYVSMLLSVQR
ncbi:odorant receptor 43a-like [Phymastichus coffea]|uniref:odorant receptor 43a-like n=1 Tax=Phymastichus coffea TaxID=108790 RepID=UPI00273C6834|nr:odorant receptor 43a-like [Phymastichus coffea]